MRSTNLCIHNQSVLRIDKVTFHEFKEVGSTISIARFNISYIYKIRSHIPCTQTNLNFLTDKRIFTNKCVSNSWNADRVSRNPGKSQKSVSLYAQKSGNIVTDSTPPSTRLIGFETVSSRFIWLFNVDVIFLELKESKYRFARKFSKRDFPFPDSPRSPTIWSKQEHLSHTKDESRIFRSLDKTNIFSRSLLSNCRLKLARSILNPSQMKQEWCDIE
jgi:hypothetical protein